MGSVQQPPSLLVTPQIKTKLGKTSSQSLMDTVGSMRTCVGVVVQPRGKVYATTLWRES